MERLDYAGSGVDRERAADVVRRIAEHASRARRPEQLTAIGGFAGAIAVPVGYQEPVLLAAADGVGTKWLLLRGAGKLRVAGIDLVAMNVNDLAAEGAEPLGFLDYVASGRLRPAEIAEVVAGIADGCVEAGCALLGGETAEVPDMLSTNQTELAGFAFGIAERNRFLDRHRGRPGDVILGCASSGPHSNGFTLIRRVLERAGWVHPDGTPRETAGAPAEDRARLWDALLRPTRIYVRAVLDAAAQFDVRGMAHITGGGIPENLPRALPDGVGAQIEPSAWTRSDVFDWLAEVGGIPRSEMFRTFNMGIGFVLVVPQHQAASAARRLSQQLGAPVWEIGRLQSGEGVQGLW